MDAAISTRALSKSFGPIRAVRGLDLEVKTGEVFGFLGPNGAGKTTTIRLLLGFLGPTSGASNVLGGSGRDPALRARIGYLPADLQLSPRYTGAEVFELFSALRGGCDAGTIQSLVDRLGLDPDRPIAELSTGNRRKVGIVCAFMHQPELLILDEPTSGLDPLLQREFEALVAESAARGATVFLSSHVLPEVERIADRVAILREGSLITVADIGDLRRRARQTISLHIDGGVEAADFGSIDGVVDVAVETSVIRVVIEGSVDALLKKAATLTVDRIVTEEADLQDMFFQFYQDEEE